MAYKAIVDEDFEFDVDLALLDELDFTTIGEGSYHVIRDGQGYTIEVTEADLANKSFRLAVNGKEVHVHLRDIVESMVHDLGLDVVADSHALELHAPMPGLVLSVDAQTGRSYAKGDKLVILEAMKMENVLSATTDVVVKAVHVEPGQAVDKGQLLISFQ